MNSDFKTTQHHSPPQQMPVAVQVVSTVLFAAFAIPVTIVALNVFWPAGILIALILAWRGGFAPTGTPSAPPRDMEEAVKSLMPTSAQKTSGNASFDAYRHDMLHRLEREQHNFEGFLSRLRDAKDQTEFDDFMDERAARQDKDRPQTGDEIG
ncbi:MAG: DUF2852 domain-containing protein [Octadecabacter sp.]